MEQFDLEEDEFMFAQMKGQGKGRPKGRGRKSCEERVENIIERYCTEQDCEDEGNAICEEENTCLKWAKLRQWSGTLRCGDNQDCIDRVDTAFDKAEEWCLKTCDSL